jgi:hypothetical protein
MTDFLGICYTAIRLNLWVRFSDTARNTPNDFPWFVDLEFVGTLQGGVPQHRTLIEIYGLRFGMVDKQRT